MSDWDFDEFEEILTVVRVAVKIGWDHSDCRIEHCIDDHRYEFLNVYIKLFEGLSKELQDFSLSQLRNWGLVILQDVAQWLNHNLFDSLRVAFLEVQTSKVGH